MSDVSDLIRQRDALSRQIETAQREATGNFARDLEVLYNETLRYAASHSLTVGESERKNVTTVTLGERIRVAFARDDGEHSTGLSVTTTDGAEVSFSKLPAPVALTGLLDGLRSSDAS